MRSALRFFDKFDGQGWLFKPVGDSLNSVFDQFYIPIYQKAKVAVLRFESFCLIFRAVS
jgi:hypothetical protein